MTLTEQQKKRLRGLGHKLKPVITVGTGGLSDSLLEEFERSLEHHELMKVKISTGDRDERDTAIRSGLLAAIRAEGRRSYSWQDLTIYCWATFGRW